MEIVHDVELLSSSGLLTFLKCGVFGPGEIGQRINSLHGMAICNARIIESTQRVTMMGSREAENEL
jgi:hypothetical protein